MDRNGGGAASECFIVPARRLRGTRREMLAQLEEAVQALVALRLVILAGGGGPQTSPPSNRYPTHGSVRR